MSRLFLIPLFLVFATGKSFAIDPHFKPWCPRTQSLVISQVVPSDEFDIKVGGRYLVGKGPFFISERAVAVTRSAGATLTLPDGSSITMGPNSELVLDEFGYDPPTSTQNFSVELIKGKALFSSSGNNIEFEINTPIALTAPPQRPSDVPTRPPGVEEKVNNPKGALAESNCQS